MGSRGSTKSQVATAYTEWASALSEGRIDDTAQYLAPKLNFAGKPYTPESWVKDTKQADAALAPKSLEIDSVMADDENKCVAARLLRKYNPQQQWRGYEPKGQDVETYEMHFVTYDNDGKIVDTEVLIDNEGIDKQLQDPKAGYEHNTSQIPIPEQKKRVTGAEMKDNYHRYVNSLNTRVMRAEFPEYMCDEIYENTTPFKRDDYVVLAEAFNGGCIPDMHIKVLNLVTDEETQRIYARLEITGTPAKEVMGFPPTGRSVRFMEHMLCQLIDGRIWKMWKLAEWALMGKQMAGEA